MRTQLWTVVGALGLTAALLSGCGAIRQLTVEDAGRLDAVKAKIEKTRQMAGEECAPKELAQAEAALALAHHEAREYEPRATIDDYVQRAAVSAEVALQKTLPCWEARQDADGDGVPDRLDRCPDTPRGAPVDARGCPTDADGDGVADYLDKCPDTPQGAPVDVAGCPADTDGDGVADYLDQCPDTPKGATVDAAGCPTDADGDGVADYLDKCPDTPRGAPVDAAGCPTDTDGDGVADYLDQCPGTPGGVKVNAVGCPIPPPPVQQPKPVELRVNFASDSAEVEPSYYPEIEKVADVMKARPNLDVVIEGHTDSVGTEVYNLKLSARRANAVAKILNERYGIALDRITAQSLGESQPIASNDTAEGRAKNRRIYAYLEAAE